MTQKNGLRIFETEFYISRRNPKNQNCSFLLFIFTACLPDRLEKKITKNARAIRKGIFDAEISLQPGPGGLEHPKMSMGQGFLSASLLTISNSVAQASSTLKVLISSVLRLLRPLFLAFLLLRNILHVLNIPHSVSHVMF